MKETFSGTSIRKVFFTNYSWLPTIFLLRMKNMAAPSFLRFKSIEHLNEMSTMNEWCRPNERHWGLLDSNPFKFKIINCQANSIFYVPTYVIFFQSPSVYHNWKDYLQISKQQILFQSFESKWNTQDVFRLKVTSRSTPCYCTWIINIYNFLLQ